IAIRAAVSCRLAARKVQDSNPSTCQSPDRPHGHARLHTTPERVPQGRLFEVYEVYAVALRAHEVAHAFGIPANCHVLLKFRQTHLAEILAGQFPRHSSKGSGL